MDKKLGRPLLSSKTTINNPWLADILQLIFSFSGQDLAPLLSYCLVNSSWYSEAIRIIWREPVFQTQVSFQLFRQTVAKNKHLANLVQVLDLQEYRYFVLKYATSLLPYLPNLHSIRFPQAIPISRKALSISNTSSSLKNLSYVEINSPDMEDLSYLEAIFRHCCNLEKLGLILKNAGDWELPVDIQPIPTVQCLELAGLELPETLLRSLLTLMPNLTRLEVFVRSTPNEFIRTITQCCKRLDHLHIECEYAEDDVLWELYNENQQSIVSRLKHFSLVYNQVLYDIPEEWMEALWRSFKSLESFRLWRVDLNDTIITSLAENCPSKLRVLDLCSISVMDSNSTEAWDGFFNSCGEQLTSLTISHSLLPARFGQTIAKHCGQLEELVIRSCKFTDTSVIAVVQRCALTLRKIKLYDTSFTEMTLKAICDECTGLEELILFRTEHWLQPLDSTPLISFVTKHGELLRSLCVRGWRTTNDLLSGLAKYAPNLQELDFENSPGLEDLVLQRVMKSCKLRQLNVTTRSDCDGLSAEMIALTEKYYVFAKRIQNPLALDMETIYGILYGSP